MKKSYDVIINGAGMAGMTLGLALHAGGLKVLLLERQPFETQLNQGFDGRSSAIAYACFRQWQALGLGDALREGACRMDEIMVTDGHLPGAASAKPLPFYLHFLASDISDRSGDEPLGYLVENRLTRDVLYTAIKDRGIDLLVPASVTEVAEDVGGATVTLDTGEVLNAKLVVSAEGRRSSLREKAGIGYINWDYGQSAVVFTLGHEKPHNGIAYEHFLPSGPFAILPMTQNRVCVVWSETHEKAQALKSMDQDLFMEHLKTRFGDFLGETHLIGDRFVYPLGLGLAEDMYKGRLALLADSAHGIHPIAGQGLNLGLKDVAALAEVLIEAARLGEDIGSELVLERYAKWRRFDNVSTSLIMDGFVRVFSNNNPLLRFARDLGMGAVNKIAPLRKFLMEDAGAATGELPKLLRGELV